MASAGVFQPRVFRGRPFISLATSLSQVCEASLRSVPLGMIGPKTIAEAQRARAMVVIRDACANRMGFLRGLKAWGSFGRGWSRRVASVEAAAVRMALTASGAEVVPVLQAQAEMAEARALREQAKTGGSVVGGGGGITLADLPNWSLALIGIATLIAIVIFIGNPNAAIVT